MKFSLKARKVVSVFVILSFINACAPRNRSSFQEPTFSIIDISHVSIRDSGGRVRGVQWTDQTIGGNNPVNVKRLTYVDPSSSAARSSLRAGDVIFAVNGFVFRNADDLDRFISAYRPGSRLRVDFFRQAGRLHHFTTWLILDRGNFLPPPTETNTNSVTSRSGNPPSPGVDNSGPNWGLIAAGVVVGLTALYLFSGPSVQSPNTRPSSTSPSLPSPAPEADSRLKDELAADRWRRLEDYLRPSAP